MTRTITLDRTPSLPATLARVVAVRGRSGAALPDLEVRQAGLRVDPGRLADYDRVCGFPVRDTLPATYLHVLTFALQVTLFADRSYPYPLAGSVHLANRIVQHRPVGVGEPLDLTVRAADARPHHRGAQVDLLGEVRVGDELVWEGVSTYLYRGQRVAGEQAAPADDRAGDEQPAVDGPGATWRLPADLGRRYARVSGDVNPIHLHPWTARAMGFPRAIVHGMWSYARMLAAIESRLPQAYEADVSFRKPVLLPSTVRFTAVADGDDQWRLALRGARRGELHARGEVRPR